MSTTAGGFPLMAQTQSSRYLTYNELAWAVDVLQRGVIDRDLSTPPGSPSEGDAYIVAAGGGGAWAAQDDCIAFYFGGVWNFLQPEIAQGNGVYVQDEDLRIRWEPLFSPPSYVNVSTGAVESVNGYTGPEVSLNGGYIGVKGADIASAGTTNLAAATGDWVDVTGTTTITALGTVSAGVERLIRFTGILTLTHNATSLILPTAANITTATGDFARFRSLGSGNWVCVAYQRASGASVRDPRVPSIQSVTSSATVTPTFSDDLVTITAQAAALALANPTGTAIPGLGMVIRIKDNGTARAITYDTQYRAIGITLPTTTVISKTTYLAMIYNSTDTKWDVVATGTEA